MFRALSKRGNGETNTCGLYRRFADILAERCQSPSDLPTLDTWECQMAEGVIDCDDVGLDETKREIYELAISPLVQPNLFQGKPHAAL